MISAGRVLPMPKGDYNALTTYEFLDIVSDNGNSYILKVDTSTGNPPTDTTKWQLLAYGGSAANVAANFAVVETTQYASQAYKVGDFLVDKDSKLCRVTAAILQGSEIIIGTNVEVTSVTALVRTVEESIAVVETKIASYSHDIGDHFYLSDVLYMATAAIQAGDTLTPGTNITLAVDVCTQINELSSDTATALNEVKSIIAPVEDTNTAVLSYSVGDQFIHNGALCKAKTAITAGDTLVFNTNYEEAGQVGDQLNGINTELSSVNEALSNEVATTTQNGAHNLNMYPYFNTSKVENGITFTDNGDGTVTVSGTASADATMWLQTDDVARKLLLSKGEYILSGCPSGGSDNTYFLRLYKQTIDIKDTGNGVSFTLDSDKYINVMIRIKSGTVISTPITFKPMIRLATDTDPTYQPYAMTNRELTEILSYTPLQILASTYPTILVNDIRLIKNGNVVSAAINGLKQLAVGTSYNLGTLPEEFKPRETVRQLLVTTDLLGSVRFFVDSNGAVSLYCYKSTDAGQFTNLFAQIVWIAK